MEKVKIHGFFCAILLCSTLFFSCSNSYNEPIREYHEYWTSTCQVGKLEYDAKNVSLGKDRNGLPNLSARGAIEINLYTINPKQIKLLCKPGAAATRGTDGLGNFCLQNEANNLVVENYSEVLVDPTHVRIRANLLDEFEGDTITLSGCLWPENRTEFTEAELREQGPELFYSAKFVQNTPPDNVNNLRAIHEFFSGTERKAYVVFQVPNQTLKCNIGSTYELHYYLRESDMSLTHKGSKILHLDPDSNVYQEGVNDNRNTSFSKVPGSGNDYFFYYFDEQLDDILSYEYTVQVTGPNGLTVEKRVTDPSLGVRVLVEPTITPVAANPPNGKQDEDEYECYEVESNDGSVSFTITPGEAGDTLIVKDGTTVLTPSAPDTYTLRGIGQHVISVKSTKVNAIPIVVSKNIRIVKTPDAAVIEFGKEFNGCGLDSDGFEYIEVDSASDRVGYTITAPEEGTTLSGKIDASDFDEMSEAKTGNLSVAYHTLIGVVHKQYCNDVTATKKVAIVKSLVEPTITCSKLNEKSIGGFECIEISASATGAAYTITSATPSGCTITGTDNGTSFNSGSSNSKTLTLALGEHTITGTVHRANYIDKPFEKKVIVITALQKPQVRIWNGISYVSDSKDSDNSSYCTSTGYGVYNVNLTSGGTGGSLTYEATALGSGETVTVTGGSTSTSGTSGTLSLGPHTLTLTVSKPGYNTQEFEEKIYIQGILADPTITFSGTADGSSGGNPIYKFSWLTNSAMTFSVSPGNTGNTVEVKEGDSSSDYKLAPDTTTTIKVIQTRTYCKTNTYTKTVIVKIKPITVSVGDCAMYCHFDDGGKGDNDIKGNAYLGVNGSFSHLKEFKSSNGFKVRAWDSYSHNNLSFVLYNASDYMCFKTEGMTECDDWPDGDDDVSEVNTTKFLSDLASAKRNGSDTKIEVRSSGADEVTHRIYLNLSD